MLGLKFRILAAGRLGEARSIGALRWQHTAHLPCSSLGRITRNDSCGSRQHGHPGHSKSTGNVDQAAYPGRTAATATVTISGGKLEPNVLCRLSGRLRVHYITAHCRAGTGRPSSEGAGRPEASCASNAAAASAYIIAIPLAVRPCCRSSRGR